MISFTAVGCCFLIVIWNNFGKLALSFALLSVIFYAIYLLLFNIKLKGGISAKVSNCHSTGQAWYALSRNVG